MFHCCQLSEKTGQSQPDKKGNLATVPFLNVVVYSTWILVPHSPISCQLLHMSISPCSWTSLNLSHHSLFRCIDFLICDYSLISPVGRRRRLLSWRSSFLLLFSKATLVAIQSLFLLFGNFLCIQLVLQPPLQSARPYSPYLYIDPFLRLCENLRLLFKWRWINAWGRNIMLQG